MSDAVETIRPAPLAGGGESDDRASETRIVTFRETDYRTGSTSSREVEAPVISRFSDHVLVRLPDGSSLRVQEKRR